MRLRRPIALALTVTAAALALAGPASGAGGAARSLADAPAVADVPAVAAPPTCQVAPDSGDFPIGTRIRKGPDTYHPGSGYRHWSLDLTNATAEGCADLHPVLVLVDRRRALRPSQIRLEFFDGSRWRPVSFERTGRDENVGVFDDGFPGFSAGPGETVTVRVRLAFTSEAPVGRVVANAALVQRRDDDGDWVGESGAYPFDIAGDDGGGEDPGSAGVGELARTGPDALLGLGAAAGGCVLGGGLLVAGSRRLRPRGR